MAAAIKAFGKGTIELTEANEKWFNGPGYKMTGETLTLGDDHTKSNYVVFTGDYTRAYTVRDCGDHYIYAGYSRYYRVDKETLEVEEAEEDF